MAFGLLLMYGALLSDFDKNANDLEYHTAGLFKTMAIFTNFCFVIFMSVGASLIFVNMKTKQRRTAFIMLPAAASEKFVERWIYATLGFAVMFFVASVAADLLRWLFCLVLLPEASGSVVAEGYRFFVGEIICGTWDFHVGQGLSRTGMALRMALLLLAGVLAHSFYILGGAFFRRNCWVLTTCSGIALILLLSAMGLDSWINYMFNTVSDACVLAADAAMAFLSALCYWGAWRMFLRMQVINNKWTNL